MNVAQKRKPSQEKFTRVIPKDIFSLKITLAQRQILLILYAIRNQDIVTYQNISMRWNNNEEPVKSVKIRSQLKRHLIELENLGYIKRCKSNKKFTHLELNFDAFKNSDVVNIPCEIFRDRTIDIKTLYIIVHYRIKNMFKRNYWSHHSKDIGITRQTLSKYVKSSNNFESKPFVKPKSKRVIPNFFLKKRLIPSNIYRGKFDSIMNKQIQNTLAVDKKYQVDDFLTRVLNYTNLNKNIRSSVKKNGGNSKKRTSKNTNLCVETSKKRLSKKNFIEYLDLKGETFDKLVYLVKEKLTNPISFSQTSIKLRNWIEHMIFDYEDSIYYSFENDYVFSGFAANALNGKIRTKNYYDK